MALKVVFCSLAVANSDGSDAIWVPKMWEDRGVQVVAHHLWTRCRVRPRATMSSLQGDKQDECPALALGRRVSLSSCGFGTLDMLQSSLGCQELLHTSRFSPAWAAKCHRAKTNDFHIPHAPKSEIMAPKHHLKMRQ